MPRHSWESSDEEQEEQCAQERIMHAWETETDSDHDSNGFGGQDIEDDIPASMQFIEYMLDLLNERTLKANQFCIAMRLAGAAGIDAAKPYGFRDGAPPGHYFRHVDHTLGNHHRDHDPDFYKFQAPGHNKYDASRVKRDVYSYPCHEMAAEDMENDVGNASMRLQEMIESDELPPCYSSHPVVQEAQAAGELPAMPFALYMDGLPYSHVDSLVNVSIMNVINKERYVFLVYRKRHFCKCGCKGWCTLYALFKYIEWSIKALHQGLFPSSRHNGTAWDGNDLLVRSSIGGMRMKRRAAILYIKLDWMEIVTSMGFPNWMDSLRPCFQCNCPVERLFAFAGLSQRELPWRQNLVGDYNLACQRSEILVTVDPVFHAQILGILRYDKRKDGAHGRVVVSDIPALNLRSGDRLEPGRDLWDIADFDTWTIWPLQCVFWRCSNESITRHRNPIFVHEAGLDPALCLVIDILHAIYLGILQVLCRISIWALISAHCFYAPIGTAHEQHLNSIMIFKQKLAFFYDQHDRAHPQDILTRVADFTLAMVGTPDNPCCKTKGAETYGIFKFLLQLLGQFENKMGAAGSRLHEACKAMDKLLLIFKTRTWVISAADITEHTGTKGSAAEALTTKHTKSFEYTRPHVIYIYIYVYIRGLAF
jgi:hypothetical protein